jgi:putative ABC transport system ATP-binding protein
MARLSVRDLVVEFTSGEYTIRPLDGFSMEAEPGQLVLLLGPSGSGKTTLLSCLGGILTPTSGSVTVGDTEVTALDEQALTDYRRRCVGIVFQAFNLVSSMSALENVAVSLRIGGRSWTDATRRAAELLEQVGLGGRADHRPQEMSGGQQQRVAIARALAMDPPLILADEPTAHLDYLQVDEIINLLRSLANEDRTVIIVTHDERMVPMADSLVELVPKFRDDHREPVHVELSAGEMLFQQGDWGDLVYVVESGEIAIERLRGDGSASFQSVRGPGEYFGEMAPMFGIQRSATATARSDVVVVGYTLRDFRANHPGSENGNG